MSNARMMALGFVVLTAAHAPAWCEENLLPDVDATRRERIGLDGERFITPAGFRVEEVASHELTGSLINMTFDALGRPVVSAESKGARVLLDTNGDGIFDAQEPFTEEVRNSMGMHYLGPGDLLLHGNGPEDAGLYRVRDTDGDGRADEVKLIMKSNGGIGEHGPHTILTGMDGWHYILYGNHSKPLFPPLEDSPSRGLREDQLLPRYVDPRGHATHITAPGGTIQRVSPDFKEWRQFAGGFRNPYDMSVTIDGEILTFDADMEWDLGLPWYRDIRAVHVLPGGDYGWRTGSGKFPFYNIDTLPSLADLGRGSPVGTCVYDHHVYPERFRGAYFMGDWSRGRIRVAFYEKSGAGYAGAAQDFLIGEPLNVTDLDIGPDGFLYFTVGGRGTTGGMYRVRFDGGGQPPSPAAGIDAALGQPMPRSAWGRAALSRLQSDLGDAWAAALQAAVRDAARPSQGRVRALELLQVLGPAPDLDLLKAGAADADPGVRAAAIYLLGLHPFREVRGALEDALADTDPFVARRACESLIRAGLNEGVRVRKKDAIAERLLALIGHDDRFLRYAARLALMRVDKAAWADAVLQMDAAKRPLAAMEGLLALVFTARAASEADALFPALEAASRGRMEDETLLDYLRVVQLALIRDPVGEPRDEFIRAVGPRMLERFPSADPRVNRELQVLLAFMQTPGTIPALLAHLTPDQSQEEQIHTVYCLRAIEQGWTPGDRNRLVEWFDRGREFGGGASLEGFINNMWDTFLTRLPETERLAAEERKAAALQQRRERALALLLEIENERNDVSTEMAQMSFAEISEYLEYDPMAYRVNDKSLERGQRVFIRAKCASCHVFGTIGTGGGPDLSTVTSRFRRRDVLEAIMFPSKVISDQYVGLEVELDDLSTVTGMAAGENDDTLILITVTGEKLELPKRGIVKRTPAAASIMPEGLLNAMSLQDLVDLINFLERGPAPPVAQSPLRKGR